MIPIISGPMTNVISPAPTMPIFSVSVETLLPFVAAGVAILAAVLFARLRHRRPRTPRLVVSCPAAKQHAA